MNSTLLSILATVAFLAGCAFDQPFAADASRIDAESPPGAATIRLGPPKVLTRASLINDRNTEVAFFNRKIIDSETAALGNDLSRDLQVISSL